MGGNLKRGSNEKIKKGPATNVDDTTLVLVPRAANGKNFGNRELKVNP